jgi:excisionase family DNA binding protein
MLEEIRNKLDHIEKLVKAMATVKEFLTVEETALYLDYSKAYVYKLCHLGILPFYRPNGKKNYFKRTELDTWIAKHRSPSLDEIRSKEFKGKGA